MHDIRRSPQIPLSQIIYQILLMSFLNIRSFLDASASATKITVECLHKFYHDELSEYITTQYLSHIVASVRKWFRDIVGNDLLK